MRSIKYLFCRRYIINILQLYLSVCSYFPAFQYYILKFIFVNHPLHTKVEETVQKTLTIVFAMHSKPLKLEREACGDHHPVAAITNPQLSIENLKCIYIYTLLLKYLGHYPNGPPRMIMMSFWSVQNTSSNWPISQGFTSIRFEETYVF